MTASAAEIEDSYSIPSEAQEVFLSFTYRGTGTVVIVALYNEGQFYLPVTELFETLMIPFKTDLNNLTIKGDYLPQNQAFELHFDDRNNPHGLMNGQKVNFGADSYIVGELDFYLLPKHFDTLFGLKFEVDFNKLMLSLQSEDQLPVEQRMERERQRQHIDENRVTYSYYPLEYDRRRKMLGGAFLDYSLNTHISDGLNQLNYNLDMGSEIMGGDLEGTLLGGYNDLAGFTNTTRNLRWRYVPGDQDLVSSISIGQINSQGLLNNTYRGLSITNEPIEPRNLFQDYMLEGTTVPQSEVEVYLNNSLIDFQEADETGYYRFQIPLTYGTSRLQVVIFHPDGSREERDERVQIPYTFLRKGEFQYHAYAGQAQSSIFSGTDEFWQIQTSGSYGLTPWLTAKAGVEYYEPDPTFQPLAYSSLSARIASKYLVNVDVAPNAFYRANANVIYPSSVSLNASYTLYDNQKSIFNMFGTRQNINGNVYLPFSLADIPLGFRLSANHQIGEFSQNTRYRAGFNSRIGRLNLRFSYLDRQYGVVNLIPSPSSLLTGTATYIFSRTPSVPPFLKGLYLQSQLDYSPYDNTIKQMDLQFSRSIFRDGRVQLSVGRNFNSNFTFAQLNFSLDFNKVRLTSSAKSTPHSTSFNQNIRGSIGYDHNYNDLFFSNRQQVGRSGASVRFYVDDNNSGMYDEGEQTLQFNAARINRSAARSEMNDDGIIRMTQLQSYYRHNFEVNEAAINNPIVVPKIDEFSFISDPNQFKQLDIPFYFTGILEGMVYRQFSNNRQPLSGVRIFLESTDDFFTKELRTFSDGSFYTYEVPPGDYRLFIDSEQLEYLDSFSEPDTLLFTVEPTANGDYISDLNFTINANNSIEQNAIIAGAGTDLQTQGLPTISETYTEYSYRIQVGSFQNRHHAENVRSTAESQLGIPFTITYNLNRGLYAVRSLAIQNRAQALELLFLISGKQLEEAVLVLTDDNAERIEARKSNKIQIGAFNLQSLAIRHARLSRIKLNMPTLVQYDNLSGLYKVYVERTDQYKTLEEQLNTIHEKWFFSDSFMPNDLPSPREVIRNEDSDFTYQIHVKGISQMSEQAYLNFISSDTDLVNDDINKSLQEELIVFRDLTNWEKAVKLKHKLDRISETERTYIVLIEKRK